ncbi:MAG: flagellar export protein FliJ [Verrucomicrobiota bacterium]|jgi:flagellar export protein FliJ
MKAFRFTLEAVRTVRQRQENDALELYARALLARQQVLDALEAVDGRINDDWSHIRQLLANGCSAAQAAQAHRFHRSLEKERDDCVAALGQAERRVQSASQAMLAARQQREIVETYREKQHLRHQRLEAREEQKLLDEFAVRRVTAIHAGQPQSSHD